MKDPEKREQYDKYGHYDDNDNSFDDFLNNFNIEDFMKMFESDFAEQPEESFKYTANLLLLKNQDLFDMSDFTKKKMPVKFPTFIYQHEKVGFPSIKGISVFGVNDLDDNENDDWEAISEKEGKKKGKLTEDVLRIFIEENTTESNTRRYKCKICKTNKKNLEYPKMKDHFIDTHEKEYNESKYAEKGTSQYIYFFIKPPLQKQLTTQINAI